MFAPLLNWRSLLALVAISIVTGTVVYSKYLSEKLAGDERDKVNIWIQSLKVRATTDDEASLNLTNTIAEHNTTIPIIATDENDKPLGEFLNLDSEKVKSNPGFLSQKI